MGTTAHPHLDPEYKKLLSVFIGVPSYNELEIQEIRRRGTLRSRNLSQSLPEDSRVVIQEQKVPARDGYHIEVRTYQPANPPIGGSPLVIFMHGGGFCIGDLSGEELNCRGFARELGCSVVNVNYRLAPEHPFPTGVYDVFDVVKWAVQNQESLLANPKAGLILGGSSAGANIAGAIIHLTRSDPLPVPISGLALLMPPCMDHDNPPEKYKERLQSVKQNADIPPLSKSALDRFLGAYKPDRKSNLYNLFAPPADFTAFPPTSFQVCELDPLRDEGLIFEEALREEYATPTRLKLYSGLPHAFAHLFPQFERSKEFRHDTLESVRWLLQQGNKAE